MLFKSMAVKRKKRSEPELILQTAIVQVLRQHLKKDVLMTAFPSGGGGYIRGGKLKRAGLVAGWPDIQLIYKGIYYGIEVKTPTGRLSSAQGKIHKSLKKMGCSVAVVRTIKELMEIVLDWNLVKRYKSSLESSNTSSIVGLSRTQQVNKPKLA